jgi:hypothetical protein
MMFVQRMNVLFVCPNTNSKVEASCCETKRRGIFCVNVPVEIFPHFSDKVHWFVKNNCKISYWE